MQVYLDSESAAAALRTPDDTRAPATPVAAAADSEARRRSSAAQPTPTPTPTPAPAGPAGGPAAAYKVSE